MHQKIKVLLSTEGTYPFHQGGVSTWCDTLINDLEPQVDFTVYSVITNPFMVQKFNLPTSAKLIKVPLWGTEEPAEMVDFHFSQFYRAKHNTTEEVIESTFLPMFERLVLEFIDKEKHPQKLGYLLYDMYLFFQEHDYKEAFKSELVWNSYKNIVKDCAEKGMIAPAEMYSLVQSLGWIYRFLSTLVIPIPNVDVAHSSAAAFCGIPCVLAKIHYKVPYILTEHGVYLREQYLSLTKRGYPTFLSTFYIRMVQAVVKMNYHFADMVSPVCSYNTRWERRYGVSKDKIKVIYNGVSRELSKIKSIEKSDGKVHVVSVARIDPIKDIKTFIESAKIIYEKHPNTYFTVYGSVTVPKYYEECIELVKKYKLKKVFTFAGHLQDISIAYQQADIVVSSSISEGFSYSIIEAMMAQKAVVATDVGGSSEALEDTGMVVPPRNPDALAGAVENLLLHPGRRRSFAIEAQRRALNYFTLENVQEQYLQTYQKLYESGVTEKRKSKQALLLEKAFLLESYHYYEEAIEQLQNAVLLMPEAPSATVLMYEISRLYELVGNQSLGDFIAEKAMVLESGV